MKDKVVKGGQGRVKSMKDPRLKTTPETPVKLYQLSLSGLSLKQAAEAMGIGEMTLKGWIKTNETLRTSWEAGRSKLAVRKGGLAHTTKGGLTFEEFVFGRLPPPLKRAWERLCKLEEMNDEDGKAGRRVLRLLEKVTERHGVYARQSLWLHALVASNFNMNEACRRVNLSKMTVTKWAERDPEFGKLLESILDQKKDFAEGCLFNLMAQGDAAVTIFVNKTLNRDRGYDPKITIEHTGMVGHAHLDVAAVLDKLSPKAKRELLQVMDSETKALAPHQEEIEDAEYDVKS